MARTFRRTPVRQCPSPIGRPRGAAAFSAIGFVTFFSTFRISPLKLQKIQTVRPDLGGVTVVGTLLVIDSRSEFTELLKQRDDSYLTVFPSSRSARSGPSQGS